MNYYNGFLFVFKFLFLFVVLCISCNSTNKNNSNYDQTKSVKLDSLSKAYEYFPKLNTLTTQSKNELVSFTDLQSFQKLILTLKQSNPYRQQQLIDSTSSVLTQLTENLSDDLSTPQILSRIRLMQLRLSHLNSFQQHQATHVNDSVFNRGTVDLLTAYNSFIMQLNEAHVVISKEMLELLQAAIQRSEISSTQNKTPSKM